jgi:hypothetical protein
MQKKRTTTEKKIVVYQAFTRLFGNKTNNKPWGTIEEKWVSLMTLRTKR